MYKHTCKSVNIFLAKTHSADYILQTTSEGEDKLTTLFKSIRARGGILANKPEAEL